MQIEPPSSHKKQAIPCSTALEEEPSSGFPADPFSDPPHLPQFQDIPSEVSQISGTVISLYLTALPGHSY
jgi:hypothetical protein